ncbi:MAG TPA: 3-phosphoglycerate dehydrogenase [Bacteroidetes bacterium]|nr:3-phosphoglycerate dehydrogenase [Bacteroidota bacterium]
MNNILANDGLDKAAIERLHQNGFRISPEKFSQEDLANHISEFEVVVVRSATKIRKQEIDAAKNLKLVIRGGVGIDNIDAEYARSKGITVCNTPLASSLSVAELVFAHLFSGVRFLHESNREMNADGIEKFKELKSSYSKGRELRGKTLGIIGFGNIGVEVARIAFGVGMNVIAFNRTPKQKEIILEFGNGASVSIPVMTTDKNSVLQNSDFISVNVSGKEEVLNRNDFELMKNGAGVINCARGGVVNENDLLSYLNNGKISFAGIDVFVGEPNPREDLLKHPRVSLSPHIAASTLEGQQRIGNEVADIIINFFK